MTRFTAFFIAGGVIAILAGPGAAEGQVRVPARAREVTITPIVHASVQLEQGGTVVHVDPSSSGDYTRASKADLVLITDIPPDHLDPDAIDRIRKPDAVVLIPQAAKERYAAGTVIANGETTEVAGVTVEAVPMYDLIPGDPFHPKGRGNGYIVTLGDRRIYIAGVTECTPEVEALEDIDVAFLPMNLPQGRMTPDAAAECVKRFAPRVVYPYHYRDGDVQAFQDALAETDVDVQLAVWYPVSNQ